MSNITRVPWTTDKNLTILTEQDEVIEFAVPSDLRFVTTPGTEGYVGTPYVYSVLALDSLEDTFIYLELSDGPSWLALTTVGDGAGILAGLPTIDTVGSHNVTIAASDGFLTIEQTYIIEVVLGSPDVEDPKEKDLGISTVLIFHKEV